MAKGEDITTRFKVDISDLKKGISEANKNIKLANAEFKAASAGMDNWGKSSDGINAKLKQLNSVLTEQKTKLENYKKQQQQLDSAYKTNGQRADELKSKLQQLANQGVSKTSDEYKKYQKALTEVEKEQLANKKASDDLKVTILNQQGAVNKTEAEIKKYSASLKDVEKAEKLAAKNGTSVEEELKKIAEQANNTESKLSSFASKLTSVLGKAALAGAAAVATGVVAMTKSAITAYAEYEQLVGGVDTLFKESSGKVQKYAQEAYKNQGMSANQYMETVTGFSASLLQSLGGDTSKAAEVANMALTDMADNANKMGTDMSSIQYAYQGFAKQNYTMLDNLKLGYGGTQKEMERLLKDATKISGVKYDIKNLNDVYQAIHVIQGELGITGTTAKEAATTIQGSASAMKSAWTNLLIGLADDNANMEELIKNFIESVGTFAQNLIPRIQEVLTTILQLVVENLPQIGTAIVQWMGTLVNNIISALPPDIQNIANAIKDGLMSAFQGLVDVVNTVITAFQNMTNWFNQHKVAAELVAAGIGILTAAIVAFNIQQAIASAGGVAYLASLTATAIGVGALSAATTIATAATTAFGAVMAFITSPVTLVVAAIAALVAGIVLLVKNWDTVKEVASNVWSKIVELWGKAGDWFSSNVGEPIKNALESVKNFFMDLPNKISTGLQNTIQKVTEWGTNVKNTMSNAVKTAIEAVVKFFSDLPYKIGYILGLGIGEVIKFGVNLYKFATTTIPEFIDKVVTFFSELPSKIWEWLVNTYEKINTWGTNTLNKAQEVGTNFITTVVNFFAQLPEKIWNWLVNTFNKVVAWATNMISKAKETGTNFLNALINIIKNLPSNVANVFSNVISKASEFVKNMASKAKEAASNFANNIKNGLANLPNQMLSIGKNIVEGVWRGIQNAKNQFMENVKQFFKGIVDGAKSALGIHSPSTVFAKVIGKQIPAGTAVGIKENMKPLFNSIKSMSDKAVNLSQNLLSGISVPQLNSTVGNGLNNNISNNSNVNNFTQNIYAPKQPSRIELYRQTRNLLDLKGGAY